MVDLHTHILYGVDDGCPTIEKSVRLVKEHFKCGVDKIFLTPHRKLTIYEPQIELIRNNFESLKSEIEKLNLNVKLYLGQEIYVSENTFDLLKDGKVLTLNDTNVVLIEFNYFTEIDILDCVCNFVALGYRPIIAHIERYAYLDWNSLYELKMAGALLQVNDSCILGKFGKPIQKRTFKAIKENLIDFVASDIHNSRGLTMHKSYQRLVRAVGKERADAVYCLNAEKLFSI